MKVSVITVCYNSANSIERTLRSVAEQSHPNIEQIVIDGSSRDNTLEVVSRYHRENLIVISEPDHGIYDAMNKGLKIATGDVVCFLNADDHYTTPDALSLVAKKMTGFNLDVLLADVCFHRLGEPDKVVRRYRASHFRPDRLAWGWMPAHPALFAKKTLFEESGPFDTSFKIAGDYDWVVRVFQKRNLRYQHIEEVLVNMRTGGVSGAGLASTILLNREVIRACRQNGIYTNWWMTLSKYPRKVTEYFLK